MALIAAARPQELNMGYNPKLSQVVVSVCFYNSAFTSHVGELKPRMSYEFRVEVVVFRELTVIIFVDADVFD